MKPLNITIVCIALVLSIYLLSGGLYRYETVQLGIIHRMNIITGDISVCVMEEGCKDFSKNTQPPKDNENNHLIIESAIFPIKYYRNNFPEYNEYTNEQLANALYAKFSDDSGLKVSKKAFFEVIGYTNLK